MFEWVRPLEAGCLDAANMQEYLAAGVRVAAVGSALEDESQLERLGLVLRDGVATTR